MSEIPFITSVHNEVKGDYIKFSGRILTPAKANDDYVQSKLALLHHAWTSLFSGDDGVLLAALHTLLPHMPHVNYQNGTWFFGNLGVAWKEQSRAFSFSLTGAGILQQFQPSGGAKGLAELCALSIHEDLALLHGAILEGLWVCLPSRWHPEQKHLQSFASIHTAVPNSQKLQDSQHNITKAMSQKGAFVRYVWTLTRERSLSLHPSLLASGGNALFYRVEQQMSIPIPCLGRSWFIIRVHVAPLNEVLNTPERVAELKHALKSLSEEMLTYKNLHDIKAQIMKF